MEYVTHRDRLNVVVHPLGCGHHRKSIGQVAHHFEGRRTRSDHHPSLKYNCRNLGVEEDPTDFEPRLQVSRQLSVGRMKPAQVHDPAHPRIAGSGGDVLRASLVDIRERPSTAHGVNEVVDHVDIVENT